MSDERFQAERANRVDVLSVTVARTLRIGIIIFAAKMIVLLAVLGLMILRKPELPRAVVEEGLLKWPPGSPEISTYFTTWDSAHYLHLASAGYRVNDPSCAFYPLWPIVIKGVTRVTRGNEVFIALLLANVFSATALAVFYSIVASTYDTNTATWATALQSLNPGGVFFLFPYSESLFFLLLMILWSGIRNESRTLTIVASFLLPLARAIGVFAVLPLFSAWAVRQVRGIGSQVNKPATDEGTMRVPVVWKDSLLSCGTPIIGWLVYLMLMKLWTGNAFEGFAAQKHWGVHSIVNLIDPIHFIESLAQPDSWHSFSGSFVDRMVFLSGLYAFPWLWRAERELLVWSWWLWIVPAMSGHFTSFLRFSACAFPVWLALGYGLGRTSRLTRVCVVGGLVAVQAVLIWRVVTFRWVG